MKGYIEKAQSLGFSAEIKHNEICVFAVTGENSTQWWHLKTLQEFISFIDGASFIRMMHDKEEKEKQKQEEKKAPRPVEAK